MCLCSLFYASFIALLRGFCSFSGFAFSVGCTLYLWLCLFRLLVLAFQFLRISLVSFFSSPFPNKNNIS